MCLMLGCRGAFIHTHTHTHTLHFPSDACYWLPVCLLESVGLTHRFASTAENNGSLSPPPFSLSPSLSIPLSYFFSLPHTISALSKPFCLALFSFFSDAGFSSSFLELVLSLSPSLPLSVCHSLSLSLSPSLRAIKRLFSD